MVPCWSSAKAHAPCSSEVRVGRCAGSDPKPTAGRCERRRRRGNPQPVQVIDKTAVRSPARKPVRRPNRRILPVAGSMRATLPGFMTAHTAPSEVSPSHRTLSPPKPSFLVQVRGGPARPGVPDPARSPPRARLSVAPDAPDQVGRQALRRASRLPIRRNPASGPHRPRSAQSTATLRDLPRHRAGHRGAQAPLLVDDAPVALRRGWPTPCRSGP
jgi:hypothetical protein